jgi:hypothetical protein
MFDDVTTFGVGYEKFALRIYIALVYMALVLFPPYIYIAFGFHHQFNLVQGSVLVLSGFSPLPIAVARIES